MRIRMWRRLREWPFSRRNVRNVNNADSTATSAANFRIVNGTKRTGFRITLGAGVGATIPPGLFFPLGINNILFERFFRFTYFG